MLDKELQEEFAEDQDGPMMFQVSVAARAVARCACWLSPLLRRTPPSVVPLRPGLPHSPQPFPQCQVDTSLSPLQAVMEWAAEGNPLVQRVSYILSIPAAAAESSLEECRNVLLPLLSQLAFDDSLDIKAATAEVLGPLGEHAGTAGLDLGCGLRLGGWVAGWLGSRGRRSIRPEGPLCGSPALPCHRPHPGQQGPADGAGGRQRRRWRGRRQRRRDGPPRAGAPLAGRS